MGSSSFIFHSAFNSSISACVVVEGLAILPTRRSSDLDDARTRAGAGRTGIGRRPGLRAAADRRQQRQAGRGGRRSEEHTSELQSPCNLVCRLLLEKKKRHLLKLSSGSVYS